MQKDPFPTGFRTRLKRAWYDPAAAYDWRQKHVCLSAFLLTHLLRLRTRPARNLKTRVFPRHIDQNYGHTAHFRPAAGGPPRDARQCLGPLPNARCIIRLGADKSLTNTERTYSFVATNLARLVGLEFPCETINLAICPCWPSHLQFARNFTLVPEVPLLFAGGEIGYFQVRRHSSSR